MTNPDQRLVELEALYRRRYPDFVRVATAITGDRDRAIDTVQDAFVRSVRSRRQVREGASVEPWVWSIVVNVARTERTRRAPPPTQAQERSQPEPDPTDRAVRALVAQLPERQRHVVFLRYYADLDYGAIAEALGIRVGTVSATLSQAHAALRPHLEGLHV